MTDDPRRELPPHIAVLTAPGLARVGRQRAAVSRRAARQVKRTSVLRRHRRETLSEKYLQAYTDAALCQKLLERVRLEEKHRRVRGRTETLGGKRLTAGDVCDAEALDAMLREIGAEYEKAVAGGV